MSDIAAMVKELIEAGTAPDVAAEIVARAFVAGAQKAKPRPPKEATYTPDFDEWWLSYPRSPNMSKKEAFAAWLKLKPEQREAAKQALTAFKEWHRSYLSKHPDYTTLHACRYLSQRRFEGFDKTNYSLDPGVYVKRDTPQWAALVARHVKERGNTPPTDRDGGWYFPRDWFPALVEGAA